MISAREIWINGRQVLSGAHTPKSVRRDIERRGGQVHRDEGAEGRVVLQGGPGGIVIGNVDESQYNQEGVAAPLVITPETADKLATKQHISIVYKLCKAAQDGNIAEINRILTQKGVNSVELLSAKQQGYTPLHFACKPTRDAELLAKRKLAARRLVEFGAEVNIAASAPGKHDQNTPLNLIKDKEFAEELALLAKNYRESLHFATLAAKDECVEMRRLLEVNLTLADRSFFSKGVEFTPFYYACSYHKTLATKLLIEYGVRVDVPGGKNRKLPLELLPIEARRELEDFIAARQERERAAEAKARAEEASAADPMDQEAASASPLITRSFDMSAVAAALPSVEESPAASANKNAAASGSH